MLEMLRDLIYHKAYANAAMLKAISQHEAATHDAELRAALHHILIANRFWLSLFLELPFDLQAESRVPESIGEIERRYHETHLQEMEWISRINEADLGRTVETTFLPGHRYSIAEGIMQVCLHSQGHRSQCATRLRFLGGTPPSMDFVIWLKDHPQPEWFKA